MSVSRIKLKYFAKNNFQKKNGQKGKSGQMCLLFLRSYHLIYILNNITNLDLKITSDHELQFADKRLKNSNGHGSIFFTMKKKLQNSAFRFSRIRHNCEK
ncbi:hypothetical protein BpHYR1_025960 [Brachionus plicatilis]|uniref:Uncharacterized protein n=1 Tax=Brachionus plicatilis TaxID=10195 RepID=A0A3M7SM48_BRAPC|nr:hypothetical protein BpHYR1_025960 [Brachionus plicatilis]